MLKTLARLASVVFLMLGASLATAAAPSLPAWLPVQGIISVNPDQLTEEAFGRTTFRIAKPDGGDDTDDIEVKGHHWKTYLYPGSKSDWDGEAVWNAIWPSLEKQGFKIVYLKHEAGGGVDATLLKSDNGSSTYVAFALTKADGYSNSLEIIQTAPQQRTLALTPPAAQPETISEKQNFPYLAPLEDAKLLNTTGNPGPLDVTASADKDTRLVGSATTTKLYEGPQKLSALDFVTTYDKAFTAAGWTVIHKDTNGGAIMAHYARNGRDIWAKLWLEGADRWDIAVADVGTALRANLAKTCKIELYGVNFDFNKATLRPDSDSVLEQVLALVTADAASKFEIGGHTDNIGKPAYNLELSRKRADAVRAWFIAHGIAAKRLAAKGYGDAVPLLPNTSDANRARNRRVEMKKGSCG